MHKNLVITHSPDMLQAEDAVSFAQDVQDGYTYPTPDITLETSLFQKFIDDVQAKFGNLDIFDFSKNKNNLYKKLKNDSIRIYISGNSKEIYSTISTKSDEIAQEIWDIFLKYTDDDERVKLYMHSYFMSNGVLDSNTKELKYKGIESINSLYYPYINTDIMFDQFFTGSENILLLVGLPGLGKSKMATLALKHAIDHPEILPYDKIKENPGLDVQFINTVYVKSTDVLVNDNFWREMDKQQIDFCVIDDLDYMLTKRDAEIQSSDDLDKNKFLNQFLSFTDGVEKHKTKFIITTNQKYDDIDTALLRKGRLFDILELRDLNSDEALNIWEENGLSKESFTELFNSDKILPAELGSEISKRLNDRIKTATESYLLEDSVSKVKEAGRTKKISL